MEENQQQCQTATGLMKSSVHCLMVSMGLVTSCPIVLGEEKISWSLPPYLTNRKSL